MSIWGSTVRPRTMNRDDRGGAPMEAAPTTAAVPDPKRWLALALVCVAFFMTVLDVSIVNVALPSIGRSLHFSETGLQWVITAYAITFGGFLLLGGRAGDILGRKRMFLVGVLIFSIASLVCGLAGSTGVLVAARTVQGLGAAIVSPATLSIITTTFEEGAERNKALGIWGAMGGSGAAAGVLFGGILTKYLGWEWIFFVNVPVGALVLALAPGIVRESRAADVGRNFDVVGASSVTAGITLLVYAISKAPVDGWSDSTTIILLIAAAALIVFFVAWETRVENPLMPLSIFRIRALAGVGHREAGLASGLLNTAQQVGGALGVAVASTVAISRATHLLHTGSSQAAALTSGYALAFWVVAGISAAGIVAAVVLVRGE